MGNKTDLIEVVRGRLVAAIASGKPLYGVKRVRVGSIDEARKSNDFPVININMAGGDEKHYAIKHDKVDNIRLNITLIANKLDDSENDLYDIGTDTGALILFEKMLNVIDKKTTGEIDQAFDLKANNIPTYSYNVNESNMYEFVLAITLQTKQFLIGSR